MMGEWADDDAMWDDWGGADPEEIAEAYQNQNVWVTADRRIVKIHEMTDEHLANSIEWIKRHRHDSRYTEQMWKLPFLEFQWAFRQLKKAERESAKRREAEQLRRQREEAVRRAQAVAATHYGLTHWDGCWREHVQCAVAIIETVHAVSKG